MRLLKGVRILDLGMFITGPYASMLLAELGADVIKVERPGQGDPFRAFLGGLYSPQFRGHNRDKRSVTLDYTRPEGLKAFKALVRTADALVINNRPGVAEGMGLGYEALREVNARLVYCAITGFGRDGPYAGRPAYDNVGQALSGWMSRHRRDGDPRVVGPAITDPITSHYAALGILAALYERGQSGVGHLVEVNLLEATIGLATEPLAHFFALGEPVPVYQRGAGSQSYNLSCRDGKRIGLHMSSPDKFWHGLCRVIERPDWIARYATRADRIQHYEALAFELNDIFRTRDRDDWVRLLEREDIPFGPELELEDLEDNPQVRHLDVFHEVVHPRHGPIKAAYRPVRVDASRDIDFRPPPDLGEHTDEVLREIGLGDEDLDRLRAQGII